jgi:FkbM family methyltransferase
MAKEERQSHGGEAVFLDIGAHWGFYAPPLARQGGMFDRIVACEPNPTNYGQLQATCS